MKVVEKKIWREKIKEERRLAGEFFKLQGELWQGVGRGLLGWTVAIKNWATKLMYWRRGRLAGSFVNGIMSVLVLLTIVFSDQIEMVITRKTSGEEGGSGYLLAISEVVGAETIIVEDKFRKGEIFEYRVQEGDTVSSIAKKFGITMDTIIWENDLKNAEAIKPKQILRILPITGVRYKVKRGETIYSIAKKYQVNAQNIIDYPYNTFTNDETFALNAGQEVMIPDGIKPKEIIVDTARYTARTVAPIPGVVGEGTFMWPTSGKISQRFYWYHQATDIASGDSPNIVASQGGTIVTAGWGGGYGNYVVIDHGNGYRTLYGHMKTGTLAVQAGDKVNQGQKIGVMGSTGRSTGPHLHFEIITAKGKLDPLSILK